MDTVLSIKNLTKRYGRITAVNDLSLEIQKGTVFGLLGPNGSGKTTTLGIILDVINRTSGEYWWFGETPTKEHRKKIGAILETPIFYPYLSATDNLKIVAKIKQVSNNNIDNVLQQVGLFERRDDKFKTYSLGMKQRLSIASALLCNPTVMILDEPTNGLDPQGIAEIRNLIIEIAKDGKTIILASHLLDEVQKVCSHFAVLKKGKMIYTGLVEDVSKGEETIEVFAKEENLEQLLNNYEGIKTINFDHNKWVISLLDGHNSTTLNSYLIANKVTVSHLVTQKKSLEKQFLEVLAASDE